MEQLFHFETSDMIAALTGIVFAQVLDPTVRGVRDIRDILDVTPLTAVPVIERSGRNPHRKMRWAFSRDRKSVV